MLDSKKHRQPVSGIVNNQQKELELFQNETLRPIIKTQHDLLIGCYKLVLSSRKVDFGNLSKEKRISVIDNSLSKDLSLKNQLIGIVIGQFTPSEFEKYQRKTSEYNKRILQIIRQRLKDSVGELT